MSCFLLFVTLISTFQNAELGWKPRLWARAVDMDVGGEKMYIRLVAVGRLSAITVSVCAGDSRRTVVFSSGRVAPVGPRRAVMVDRVAGQTSVGLPSSMQGPGSEPALEAGLVDEPGRHLGPH